MLVKTKTEIISDPPDLPSYQRVRERSRFIVGWDVGKISDPSAVVIVEHKVVGTSTWHITERIGKPSLKRQQAADEFKVRDIRRMALGTPYPQQIQSIVTLMSQPELNGAELVVDAGGVGTAEIDSAEQAGLQITRLTITGGRESRCDFRGNWHVAKMALVLNLDAHMQNGGFKVAADLGLAGALFDELKEFRRHYGASGIMGFEAPPGKHDDVLMACCIALWICTRPPKPVAQFGTWGQQ
jgi:hypothetical protein